MTELPWFKFEAKAWLSGDIQFCSLEAQGLFINCCALIWKSQASIPLAMLHRRYSNATSLPKLIQELEEIGILSVKNDRIDVDFLMKQMGELIQSKERRSAAGRKGGLAKASNALAKSSNQKRREEEVEEIREDNNKPASESDSSSNTDLPNPYLGCDGQPPKDPDTPAVLINPEREWQMIQCEDWAKELKRARCKIGPNCWMEWQALLKDTFYGNIALLTDYAGKVDAKDRFAPNVESRYVSDHPTAGSSGAVDL